MMNKEEFTNEIAAKIATILPEDFEGAEITVSEHEKNNGLVLTGLTIHKPGSDVSPIIYLDQYYKHYCEKIATMDDILLSIKKILLDNPGNEYSNVKETIVDFANVKDKIFVAFINKQRNAEKLLDIPYTEMEDLAVIYKVMLTSSKEGTATITITNPMMEQWGITKEELHALSVANSRRILPPEVLPLGKMVEKMMRSNGMSEEQLDEMCNEIFAPDEIPMFVITNDLKLNGAATIYYSDVLEKIAEKLRDDLYILPSSIHEVIAIPSRYEDLESLSAMVKEVNSTQVAEEEQLSDNVYMYTASTKELHIATR